MRVKTPIMVSAGHIDWVYSWRVDSGQSVLMYGVEFNSPYCPVEFVEVNDDAL